MGQIQVLSFEVANLIAAGEVVDRPASAIKEMMENSIDAGATHITVEIQNGGVRFMRVTDDGCGMSPEDLPMAIRRHATSKIREADDLDGITTLGFRGEALAAISSVSDMRILSRRKGDDMGAMLEIEGGRVLGVTEYGCQEGTTVIVENLFANVPARRKFLKRDVTETMAVSANVERVALSHPEIAVRLICDGVTKLETAGDGQLKSAIYAVFGRDFAGRLIPVDGEYESIRVHGFIGRSDNVKANRNYQNFFINNRYIKSKTACAALEQAYVSYLPPEKFPCCVLYINLNPAQVDVNVHPAKLEVKFSNEKPVFESIYYAVRQALEQNTARPEMRIPTSTAPVERVSDAQKSIELERPESLQRRQVSMYTPPSPPAATPTPTPAETDRAQRRAAAQSIVFPPQERKTAEEYRRMMEEEKPAARPVVASPAQAVTHTPPAPPAPPVVPVAPVAPTPSAPEPDEPIPPMPHTEPPVAEAPAEKSYRMVGEVFHSYIIVEWEDRMLLIDKHAAHERLIFEHLKANMKAQSVGTQMLMLPIEVMMMSGEVALLDEYRGELEQIGFSFSCMKNTVQVDGIPSGISPDAVPDMLAVFAERLQNGTGTAQLTRDILFEKALYQASCKAAIKAGWNNSAERLSVLVDQLMALPDITVCPHGRPVAMEMKKRTIDHLFERC